MALSKDRAAITQLTATGNSSSLNIASSYEQTLYVQHVNGTGTITTQGSAVVQVQTNGGTLWFNLSGATLGFGTTASATTTFTVALPDDAGAARLVYTAPAGSTGHTLDAEVGRMPTL